ncbi:MAG: NADH-quinone oxidoreductase subunit A, partial [Phycisphaerales bacterium]|nr:NADH-quinone oxidoreductase subunit A [Phycisphaerales bacterium]
MTAILAETDLASYAPIGILFLAAVGFAAANIVLTFLIGPRRDGARKSSTYESGMNPVGTARKRFNVRFYLIAIVFLVFDVEVIFLYPLVSIFANLDAGSSMSGLLLVRMLFF